MYVYVCMYVCMYLRLEGIKVKIFSLEFLFSGPVSLGIYWREAEIEVKRFLLRIYTCLGLAGFRNVRAVLKHFVFSSNFLNYIFFLTLLFFFCC